MSQTNEPAQPAAIGLAVRRRLGPLPGEEGGDERDGCRGGWDPELSVTDGIVCPEK